MSEYDKLEKDVRDLRKEVNDTKEDVATIKTHVTNHIPHVLEAIQHDVKELKDRITPFETKAAKIQGVSEFLTLVLKAVSSIAAVTWIIMQILRAL